MPRTRPPARSSATTSSLPFGLAVCFLLSGAAGLLYEVVWSKQLAYLLGGSRQSVATVVAAFLGGLALGARTLGSRLASRARPARTYALLEAGVALLGVSLLPLLRSLDAPVGQLYRAFGGESAAFAIARVALLFVLLVPPAALMGATLPVLVARCERGALGAGLAGLYAINTLGAVAGSVLGGFLLLPALGLTATTLVAAALNLVAAAIAWFMPSEARDAARASAATPAPVPAVLGPAARTVFAGLFAVSGFTALLLQLAWVRLFGLILGSSVYSFSAVLGIYLLGLAVGSAAMGPLLARGRVLPWWFTLLQLGLALTSVVGIHAYAHLPKAMLDLGERAGASWGGLLFGELAIVASLLALPCLLLGAVFPLATRLLQHGAAGPTTGGAYAVNTLGTIAGSLATGFLLLPALGVQGVVLLAAGLAALAGIAAWLLPGAPRPAPAPLTAALVLGVAALLAGVTAPRWEPLLMSLGTFRPHSAQNLLKSFRESGAAGDPTRALAANQSVVFYRDGINASVLVVADRDQHSLWMRMGGKVEGGTKDMLTQVLVGVIPAVMADSGARTLVVGHGTGATAAAALAAGIGRTDIVELEPAIVSGSRYFHEPGHDPLDDPRVTLHLEDARTLLAHGGGEYGAVISQPSNPWVVGVNNLFTVDFYRRVRARLRPDGVFCQWLQLYELSPETFQSLLASFLTVFPDAHLFCVWGSADALLVAAPSGRNLSLSRLRAPGLAYTFERARIATPEQLAAYHVASGPALRAMAVGGELNTDERPFVEYRAPRDMIEVGRLHAGRHPGVTAQFTLPVLPEAGSPIAEWPREAVAEWRARQRLAWVEGPPADFVFTELRDAGLAPLAAKLAAERAESVRAAAATDPLAEARELLSHGDADGASVIAERQLAVATGAARLEPLLLLGVARVGSERNAEALASFEEAQRVAPADGRAYTLEARVRLTTGDVAATRRGTARGVAP